MLKFLFGDKSKHSQGGPGKSVNQVRGRKGRPSVAAPSARGAETQPSEDTLDARIKTRRARNLRLADAKAALASAGYIPKPDVAGAIFDAKHQVKAGMGMTAGPDQKAVIDRALRLKAAASTIDDALRHPAWRYVAMAVIRGQLQDKPDKDGL